MKAKSSNTNTVHKAGALKVAILGASGYTGAELLRLLSHHPHFAPYLLTAESQAGQKLGQLYPHLVSYSAMPLYTLSQVSIQPSAGQNEVPSIDECELVFCGLPHGEAMRVLPALKNKWLIDLGGDFRLPQAAVYESWYKCAHLAPDQLGKWAYGMPELFRDHIKGQTRVANPGCYPTASALAMAPLVKAGLIEGTIVIDAYSGTSGAGRAAKAGLHFSHVDDDARAYKIGEHQHTPEIELALSRVAGSGKAIKVSFTPHLLPSVRGIHATCSAQAVSGLTQEQLTEALKDFYKDEYFVRVLDEAPGIKQVRASNFACMYGKLCQHSGRVIVTSVIDNLVKGAAGQAIQNANILAGLPEELGLEAQGVYP